MTLEVIILAAGQGTRMRSSLPKVLHTIAGKPMLAHVIESTARLAAKSIHVVVGHGAELVKAEITGETIAWVTQEEQLGTGHAVQQAIPDVDDNSIVLVAYGDVPLVATDTLSELVSAANSNTLSLLTVELEDPTGYGRIVRDNAGSITEIVEQKDASPEQLNIVEVNTGIMAVSADKLKRWLPQLSSENAQAEYYLTDIIAMAVAEGILIKACHPDSHWEVQGVNNRIQQSELERVYQMQKARALMEQGVTLLDPQRIDIRGNLVVGSDVCVDINCVFIGDVRLDDGVSIGPNCIIENSTIGEGTIIKANSVIEESQLGAECDIGPFARLRPGTQLAKGVKIGNFVETKKANIGEYSKVNHLSYVGDSEIGRDVNVGAGTITCNYDGANKHKTVIGDNSFIGSNTALVAPVKIGKGATVGAGSTINMDVADGKLAISRSKQRSIDNWQRPVKKKP